MIVLPVLEDLWEWQKLINPHLPEVDYECSEWSASFGAFDLETQLRICNYGKLSKFSLGSKTHLV